MTDLNDKVIEIISKLTGIDINGITSETSIEYLGINSVIFVKLVVLLENEFNIEIEDEYLDYINYKTVNDIILSVKKLTHM